MRCEQTGNGEAHSVLGQRNEELGKTSRHVCNLNPSGNRALTQAKPSYAVIEEILVPRSR